MKPINSKKQSIQKTRKKDIFTISIYHNSKEEEIVIFGGKNETLFFYNLGRRLSENKEKLVKKVKVSGRIFSSKILNNKYLFVGGKEKLFLFDVESSTIDRIGEFEIHSEVTNDLRFINHKGRLKLISCSDDRTIKLNSIIFKDHKEEKRFLEILNTHTIRFLETEIKQGYCEKTKDELDYICKYEIISKCISEYLNLPETKKFNLQEECDYLFEYYTLFLQTNNFIYLGEFSASYEREGFGVEFLKSPKDENIYKLFYIGTFSDGKREGKGKIFFSRRKCVREDFLDGKIDLASYLPKFDKEIKKMKNSFDLKELFSKERTKLEMENDDLLFSISSQWMDKVNHLINSLFGIEEMKEFEFKLKELDIYNIYKLLEKYYQNFELIGGDSSLYFGLSENGKADGFGIEFLGKMYMFYTSKYYTPLYIGDFKNGKREGNGKIFEISDKERSIIFSGEFKNGKRNGRGVEYTYNRRDKYNLISFQGIYRKGKKNGKGRIYDLRNRKYIYGIWKNDQLVETKKEYICPIMNYCDLKKYLTQDSQIGSGAVGIVYRIKSSHINNNNNNMKIKDEFVAVKVLKRSFSSFERDLMFKMVKRGIKLCSFVGDKTNILETYGVFRDSHEIGCIMEYCKCSIDQEIIRRKGRINFDEKMKYLLGVVKGMLSLHKMDNMHRDLKWGNILLTLDNEIKITDFDTLRENERKWNLNASTLTSKVGTPGYSAPEIHLGKKYGLPCDIFSFGIMIYALLFEINQPYLSQFQCQKCGVEVSNMLSINSLHTHVSHCNFRPLLDPEKISKYPRFLIDLMILCWDKDPSKRPLFEEIFLILDNEMKNKKEKSYFLLEFEFPSHQEYFNNDKLLLLPKDENEFYLRIISFLTTSQKYDGSKIKNMDSKIGSIYGNSDILELLKKEINPVIKVEFSEFKKKKKSEFSNEKEKERLKIEIEELKGKIYQLENKMGEMELEEKKREMIYEDVLGKKDEIIEEKEIALKKSIMKDENEKVLLKKYFEKKGLSIDDFNKFCEFQKEEIEGEGN